MLHAADSTVEEAEAIYMLMSPCTFDDRFVIPPMHLRRDSHLGNTAPWS